MRYEAMCGMWRYSRITPVRTYCKCCDTSYITADAINDAGWRQNSPSTLRRVFADLGARGDQTEFHVNFTGADNTFGAATATPVEMLNQSWSSTYTIPQTTHNQLAFLTASANWKPSDTWTYTAIG